MSKVDVKFLKFQAPDGGPVRRFQYTAIDDATRTRALQVHEKHNQEAAIRFVDYVLTRFHWHLEDLGIRHVYIKPRTPTGLMAKWSGPTGPATPNSINCSTYTDDVDLNTKLTEWKNFYNLHRLTGPISERPLSRS